MLHHEIHTCITYHSSYTHHIYTSVELPRIKVNISIELNFQEVFSLHTLDKSAKDHILQQKNNIITGCIVKYNFNII